MLRIMIVVLYTALGLGANPGIAQDVASLRTGDMKKLAIHAEPTDLPAAILLDADDMETSLDAYRGKWVVLNFWATWCAPCRHEMPSLDRLQVAMPQIAVVPVATGPRRNSVPEIRKFFETAGVTNLPMLREPGSDLATALNVKGLPVTLILNPEGQEVARLIGGAEWDSDSAMQVLDALCCGS